MLRGSKVSWRIEFQVEDLNLKKYIYFWLGCKGVCPFKLALHNFHNTTYINATKIVTVACFFLYILDKFNYLQSTSPQSFIEEQTLSRRIWPDEGDMWWLGGYRSSLTDDFVWQDGSDFIYSNWHVDEPNNFLGTEDCFVAGATG